MFVTFRYLLLEYATQTPHTHTRCSRRDLADKILRADDEGEASIYGRFVIGSSVSVGRTQIDDKSSTPNSSSDDAVTAQKKDSLIMGSAWYANSVP